MKTITKTLISISALSLLLAGCGDAKKADKSAEKPTTIEEIQKVKGKPARVAKAGIVKLTDVRAFSGTIEGSQQTKATAKLGDPIAKVNVRVGSKVKKDQVLAEFVFTGDNTAYQQAQANMAMKEKTLARTKEVQAKGGVSQQDCRTARNPDQRCQDADGNRTPCNARARSVFRHHYRSQVQGR